MAKESVQVLENATDWPSAFTEAASASPVSLHQGSISFANDRAWLKIDLSDSDADILYFPSHSLDRFKVYDSNTNTLLFEGGDSTPQLANWNPETSLPLSRHWGETFFLELELSPEDQVSFELMTFDEYKQATALVLVNSGIYYGGIILMALFSLLLSVFSKDPDAWRLGVTLLTWFVSVFTVWGYGDISLPFNLQNLLLAASNQILVVSSITSAWFSINFLDRFAKHCWGHKGLKLCMYAGIVYMPLSAILGINWVFTILLMISTGVMGTLACIEASRNGDKAAHYLLGSSVFAISPFIFLFFTPLSQQAAIGFGIASLTLIMLSLMHRVSERFHELGRQARVASERERFLASMSHEIRTPLNGIIGFSELCNQEDLEGDVKHYFDQIDRSSKMLLGIVNDVLDYSKLQAEEVDLVFEPMSVKQTLEDVLTVIRPQAAQNSISLSYEIAENIAEHIVTDPYRCAQVLINLCGNAVKFSTDGNVLIKVSRAQNIISFDVIDNGVGIDKDLLAGLFNPFSQADAETARKFGGTGLGLAISKQLCQLLGGELSAVSKKGEGSTFSFRLPYKEGKALALTPNADVAKLAGKKVLLAEDNAVNLLLATRILEKNGLLIDSATDGKIALEKASKNHYDFILMDMQMPELSGTEATEEIRKLGFDRPIIAMTANTADSDKEACINAGMSDYLAKPIEQQQLLRKLEHWAAPSPVAN